jgi:hypothetical protein
MFLVYLTICFKLPPLSFLFCIRQLVESVAGPEISYHDRPLRDHVDNLQNGQDGWRSFLSEYGSSMYHMQFANIFTDYEKSRPLL